jgi:hypothetical protein
MRAAAAAPHVAAFADMPLTPPDTTSHVAACASRRLMRCRYGPLYAARARWLYRAAQDRRTATQRRARPQQWQHHAAHARRLYRTAHGRCTAAQFGWQGRPVHRVAPWRSTGGPFEGGIDQVAPATRTCVWPLYRAAHDRRWTQYCKGRALCRRLPGPALLAGQARQGEAGLPPAGLEPLCVSQRLVPRPVWPGTESGFVVRPDGPRMPHRADAGGPYWARCS